MLGKIIDIDGLVLVYLGLELTSLVNSGSMKASCRVYLLRLKKIYFKFPELWLIVDTGVTHGNFKIISSQRQISSSGN